MTKFSDREKVYILGGAQTDFARNWSKEGKGIAFPFPTLFGQLVDELIAKYHYDENRFMNALAIISDQNYRNAKHNPNAQTRMLFKKKIEDAVNSKYMLPWTRRAVEDAYNRSGLSADDINVFETHDCFTSSEFAAISAFCITNSGEEIEAIEKGIIAFDGKYPINPSGGLIGCGHPVGASGVRMLLDCYKQVANEAGGYQVSNVTNAMMLNIGGTATTNYTYIVGK